MNINWKQVIIGFILIFVLSVIFSIMADETGAYIGYLLGTIYVGYAVGKDYKSSTLHGALTAFLVAIFGIISLEIIILLAGIRFHQPLELSMIDLVSFLYEIILYTIIGAIGGLIGSVLKGND